jgi:RimJ/RimL family protein N-acetyltransferase
MVVVETARLRLRPFTLDDVDAYYAAVYGDPDVMRYLPGGVPRSRERTQQIVEFFMHHREQNGFAPWAVIHKADNRLIGECGLNTVFDSRPREIEVLYALAKPYWGQGFATEGARASLRFGFEEVDLQRIIGLAMPENTASRRVMEKLGMRYEGIKKYYGMKLATYTITREAFRWDGSPYRVDRNYTAPQGD